MMKNRVVTIGIPVFNDKDRITRTIESCLAQDCVKKIIVSDNCSTDESEEYYRKMCLSSNVEYRRWPQNIGASKNFEFLLNLCKTEYFMWVGSHDLLPLGYIKNLVASLEANEDVVLAFGRSQLIDVDGKTLGANDYSESYLQHLQSSDARERVLSFIKWTHDGAMFHGIMKTESAKVAWKLTPGSLVTDANLLPSMLLLGKFRYCESVLFQNRIVRKENIIQRNVRYNRVLKEGLTLPVRSALGMITSSVDTILKNLGFGYWERIKMLFMWHLQYFMFGIPAYCGSKLFKLFYRTKRYLGKPRV